jgi:hypothetical protein
MDRAVTLVTPKCMRARICFGLLPIIFLPPFIKYHNVEHTGLKLTHILYRREAAIEAKQPNVYLLIIAVLSAFTGASKDENQIYDATT